jgi:hypothetical protein
MAGFEGAIFLRVALNLAARIKHCMVTDGNQGPLRQIAPVVEDPSTDPDTQQTPDHILEGGSVEDIEIRVGRHLPQSLVPPEVRLVVRAQPRFQPTECREAALDQNVVRRAEQDAEGEKRADHGVIQHLVEVGGGHPEESDQEQVQPADEQEDAHGPQVVSVLFGNLAPQVLAGLLLVELVVPLDRSGYFEGR